MPRLQLSLNVSDLDAAVEFYRRLFGTEPAKLKPGYAQLRHRLSAAQARPQLAR
jgi:catechol 2,3-dioxygenase-like lactoylglutathione lyase family enzyme